MKNKVVLALSLTTIALTLGVQPSHAQVDMGLDFNGGSIGIGGIPGISASPFPATSITPSTVGGGNASAVSNVNGFAPPSVQGQQMTTPRLSNASTPGMPTSQQAIQNATNRGVGLNNTSMNLMAPNSVDTSAFPSGQWNYGFPNEGTAPFMGVSKGTVGGFLSPVSTSSVDINTYDGPLANPFTNSIGIGMGGPGLNFSIPVGPVNINGSLNPVQAINSVQDFFGQ